MHQRDTVSHWTMIVAAVGATVTALIVLTSYLPGAPIVPQAVVFVLFAAVIPIFATVVVRTRGGRQRLPSWAAVPRVARRLVFCGGVAMVLIAGLSIDQLRGQPTIHNGRYFFDDHGSLIPTTTAGYRHGISLEERIFGGGACLFYGAACVFSACAIPRQRTARLTLD